MSNVITVLIILLILGGAVTYIVRAKKRGVKCVGCPDAGSCSARGAASTGDGAQAGCGCGCHENGAAQRLE